MTLLAMHGTFHIRIMTMKIFHYGSLNVLSLVNKPLKSLY